jgi:hypothetical protein
MSKTGKMLLAAAVAGMLSASGAVYAGDAKKAEKKADKTGQNGCGGAKSDNANCYGVNKCKGAGKCGGQGGACAGTNSCKGMGWLPMPKDSCLAIEGGMLEPKKG